MQVCQRTKEAIESQIVFIDQNNKTFQLMSCEFAVINRKVMDFETVP